jgi:hypothetical protein
MVPFDSTQIPAPSSPYDTRLTTRTPDFRVGRAFAYGFFELTFVSTFCADNSVTSTSRATGK